MPTVKAWKILFGLDEGKKDDRVQLYELTEALASYGEMLLAHHVQPPVSGEGTGTLSTQINEKDDPNGRKSSTSIPSAPSDPSLANDGQIQPGASKRTGDTHQGAGDLRRVVSLLQQLRSDMTDAPAIGLGDGKFYRTVPDERLEELEAVLSLAAGVEGTGTLTRLKALALAIRGYALHEIQWMDATPTRDIVHQWADSADAAVADVDAALAAKEAELTAAKMDALHYREHYEAISILVKKVEARHAEQVAAKDAQLAEAVSRAVAAETASTTAQALREIAKYLSPENENVKQGYLLPCIRDLAQAKVSAIDSYNDLKTLMRNTRAMCAFGDCADHYGDPLAWCLKCQLAKAESTLADLRRQGEWQPKEDEMILVCQEPDCGKAAEFVACASNRSDPDNEIHACEQHLGQQLGTTVGFPTAPGFHVYPIPARPLPDPPEGQ